LQVSADRERQQVNIEQPAHGNNKSRKV